MATSLVLTVIGQDQPGLVEMLSETIGVHEGSWENSRMARLGGCFAGILEVRVPAARVPALSTALAALAERGLEVTARIAAEGALDGPHRALRLDLIGQDRPGIVREISSALAGIQVNVVELETGCTSAPMSGETLFNATAELHHPVSLDVEELRETLEKIAADLMVDISLDDSTD